MQSWDPIVAWDTLTTPTPTLFLALLPWVPASHIESSLIIGAGWEKGAEVSVWW